MSALEELIEPGRCAVLTMEVQRGVVGDLAAIRPLADTVTKVELIPRIAALLEAARGRDVVFVRNRCGSDASSSHARVSRAPGTACVPW